jgi:hypothetical protein
MTNLIYGIIIGALIGYWVRIIVEDYARFYRDVDQQERESQSYLGRLSSAATMFCDDVSEFESYMPSQAVPFSIGHLRFTELRATLQRIVPMRRSVTG